MKRLASKTSKNSSIPPTSFFVTNDSGYGKGPKGKWAFSSEGERERAMKAFLHSLTITHAEGPAFLMLVKVIFYSSFAPPARMPTIRFDSLRV